MSVNIKKGTKDFEQMTKDPKILYYKCKTNEYMFPWV